MNLLKLLPYSSVPKQRKIYINSCVQKFYSKFQNDLSNNYAVTRNRVGIPLHTFGTIKCLMNMVTDFCDGDAFGVFHNSLWAKINLDLATWVNNINKKKASLFSDYMKSMQINDENELKYGMRKFLYKIGSYHYPILHPNKTNRLATTGKYTKNIETGIVVLRTDDKSLVKRLEKYFKSRATSVNACENKLVNK